MARTQIIHLHTAAPPKPAPGAACNGCGVCCALETCPAARLLFWKKAGPCPALQWTATAARYHCGLLLSPATYLRWLPGRSQPITQRLFHRWIAADTGCDCSAEAAATE